MTSLQKSHRFESAKIKNSARGQECQIRIPGICKGNNETVVLCHLNGGGAGTKHSDLLASYGCNLCHDAVDGRTKTKYFQAELELFLLEGMVRTQQMLLDAELVVLE